MNTPAAIGFWLLLPGLVVAALVLAGEMCAARVNESVDVALARSRELPDVPLFDQEAEGMGDCGDPNWHAARGCPDCIEAVVTMCGIEFDRTLAELFRREGQR